MKVAKHCRELLRDSFEHILNGGGVPDEGGAHLESARRNIADRGFDVIRDPLHEIRGVLVLDIEHLLVHFLGAHPPPEQGRSRQISSVARSEAHIMFLASNICCTSSGTDS